MIDQWESLTTTPLHHLAWKDDRRRLTQS